MRRLTRCIDNNLLVATAISFIGGIVFAPHLSFTASTVTHLGLLLALLLIGLTVLQFFAKNRMLLVMLPLFFAGLGCFYTLLHLRVPPDEKHIYNRVQEKCELVVIGTMTAMAQFDGRTSQIPLAVKSLHFKNSDKLTPASGTVLLRLKGPWPESYRPGDRLAVRGDFKRPTGYRTPGGFDYAQYLARQDIWVTGFVRSPRLLQSLPSDPTLLGELRYLPERLRVNLGNHIDRALGPAGSSVYRAILIGDRSRVDDAILETFKGSGTMHILAISGMHMAVIGSLVYGCIYFILSRSEKLLLLCNVKKWAAFFSLPILIGYGLLAGLSTPVARAVVMSTIVIIAICTDRRKSPGPLVAFAALLLLTFDPLLLFSASFQLSFSAVIAIMFLLPTLQNLFGTDQTATAPGQVQQKLIQWFLTALLVSLAATVATAPIAVHAFNRFSPTGLLANLIVEPLICLWCLPSGFLAIPFSLFFPEIAALILQAGNLGLQAALQVTAFCSSFSFSTVWLPEPPFVLLLGYYTILIVFAVAGYRSKRLAVASVSFLLLCVLFFIKPSAMKPLRQHPTDFRISYLDVGQGSSTLVEFPSDLRVLIDGGGGAFGSTNVGERVIAPFLWQKGIDKLDAVIITHPDTDHYSGLDFILEHFSPNSLWIRDRQGHDDNFRNILHLADKKQIPVIIPEKQYTFGTETDFIACLANTLVDGHSGDRPMAGVRSNSGLVLKTCSGDFCALFPGDIEKEEERMLVATHEDLDADVLLAPHHGSATSGTPEFLAAVSPQYLIVSARKSSSGHFPHAKVKDECAKQQIALLSTAQQGTIELEVTRDGYRLYGFERVRGNPLYPMRSVMLQIPAEIRPR